MTTSSLQKSLAMQGLALSIGLPCGVAANAIGLPLPWMLGPMIGTTIAALAHAPVKGPLRLRPIVIPVIGVMLGAGFHPELLGHLGEWLLTLVILPVFLLVAGGAAYAYYRHIAGYNPITAFFSAAPGGFNEMILLAGENGGDDRKVALAHAIRVLATISLIALTYALFFDARAQGGRSITGFADLSVRDYAILLACAVVGAVAGKRLKLPAAGLFGPMILSAGVHLTSLVTLPPPTLLVIAAQIVMGTIIGCRFVGERVATIGREMVLGIGATLIMLGAAASFATLVSALSPTAASQAFLAFTPGGLTEMSLLALAMGQDVAYVSVTHVVRIALIVAIVPLIFRLTRR